MSTNALRSSVSEDGAAQLGLSNGGLAGLMIRLRAPLSVVTVQIASATWLLMSPQQRHRDAVRQCHVDVVGDEHSGSASRR